MRKEDRLLRVGVLGCGPIAQFAHLDAARKARNCELYAICDLADDLREKMAAIHEPKKSFARYEDMLADPQVEAVVIAIADQFHVPMAAKAIAAGKHVLCEKPLGVSVEECEAFKRQIAASDVTFLMGNMKRFDPGIQFAHRFIREEMGQLMALKAWYCDSTYRYTMTDNLQPIPVASAKARRPEGNPKADKRRYFMLTHGSHLVDTARFLGGEIRSVRARLVEKFGAYCWFVDVDFADGAVGLLDLTIAVRGDFQEGFQIWGEHGSINARTYLPWFYKSSDVECFSTKDGLHRRPLGEDGFTYKRQLEALADHVLHAQPTTGGTIDDGVAAVRAMVAIARSVETGESVRLADVTGAV